MATRDYTPNQQLLFLCTPQDVLSEDHLCYFIDEVVEKLDFSLLPDRSTTAGRPEYDPRLKTKVLLYGYATGVYSSRKLMTACREHIPFMFLTRGQFPDFRTLSDFRKDNLEFLADAFVQVVRIAQRIGLVRLGTVATDGAKVRATASGRTFKDKQKLLKLRKRVAKELLEAVQIDEQEDAHGGSEGSSAKLPQGMRTHTERLKKIDRALEELEQSGRKKVSLSDPESVVMKHQGGKGFFPSYNCQISVDTESQVIVAASTSRKPVDSEELAGQLDKMESTTGKKPDKVLADNGYYTVENLLELERRGIEGYIPDQLQAEEMTLKAHGKEVPERQFDKRNFVYDAERDLYICPLGKELVRDRKQQPYTLYRCNHCRDCPRKPECATGKSNRAVCRHEQEGSMQRMRRRMDDEQGRKLYRKRFTTVEPVIAWMKWAKGFERFRLRGKLGAEKELLTYCIGHNIKQIAKHIMNVGPNGTRRSIPGIFSLICLTIWRIVNVFMLNPFQYGKASEKRQRIPLAV